MPLSRFRYGNALAPRVGHKSESVISLRAALSATPLDTDPSGQDFAAQAERIRSEHEATHGEAEQCGADCIALGLASFDDDPTDPSDTACPDCERTHPWRDHGPLPTNPSGLDSNMDYERRDAMLDVVRRQYAADPSGPAGEAAWLSLDQEFEDPAVWEVLARHRRIIEAAIAADTLRMAGLAQLDWEDVVERVSSEAAIRAGGDGLTDRIAALKDVAPTGNQQYNHGWGRAIDAVLAAIHESRAGGGLAEAPLDVERLTNAFHMATFGTLADTTIGEKWTIDWEKVAAEYTRLREALE